MNQLITTAGQPATMTSLELVEFINSHRAEQADARGYSFPCENFSRLRHDHFIDKVHEVLRGVPLDRETYRHPQNGQIYNCYRFKKREACLMAMSYSYELQAKVFDRMTDLETAQAPAPAELSRMDILKLAMESEEARIKAEAERDEAIRTKALIGSKREATAMATAAAKAKEVKRLQQELGRGQMHATVIAVENALKRKFPKNAYVALRKSAKANGVEPITVADPRWGTAKAWPAIAWMDVHGIDLAEIFHTAE